AGVRRAPLRHEQKTHLGQYAGYAGAPDDDRRGGGEPAAGSLVLGVYEKLPAVGEEADYLALAIFEPYLSGANAEGAVPGERRVVHQQGGGVVAPGGHNR